MLQVPLLRVRGREAGRGVCRAQEEGMVNVTGRRCEVTGCKKQPYYA